MKKSQKHPILMIAEMLVKAETEGAHPAFINKLENQLKEEAKHVADRQWKTDHHFPIMSQFIDEVESSKSSL